MKKGILLVAPMVMSIGVLASCGQKQATEWATIKKSADIYEKTLPDHRALSTYIDFTVNSLDIKGSVNFKKFKLENGSVSTKDMKVISAEIPVSTFDKILTTYGSALDDDEAAFVAYLAKLPISDYVLLFINGVDVDKTLPSEKRWDYENLKSKPWANLTPTYKFEGSGDNAKLKSVNVEIKSMKAFFKEIAGRFDAFNVDVFDGDASGSGSIEVDTNTGYVTSIKFGIKSTSNLNIKVTKGSKTFSLNGTINGEASFNFKHNDATKVTLQYQAAIYEPTLVKNDIKNYFIFDKAPTFSKTYSKASEFCKDYEIEKMSWKNAPKYDDPIKKKSYYLTDDLEKNVAFEGFDYEVFFEQKDTSKYGMLPSDYIDNTTSLKDYAWHLQNKPFKDSQGTEYEYVEGFSNLRNPSTIRYNSVVASFDGDPTTFATVGRKEGYIGYFGAEEIYGKTGYTPYIHIDGSGIYNAKGTYVVTVALFKK